MRFRFNLVSRIENTYIGTKLFSEKLSIKLDFVYTRDYDHEPDTLFIKFIY